MPAQGGHRLMHRPGDDGRMTSPLTSPEGGRTTGSRWAFGSVAVILVAYLVSLIVRPVGAYNTVVDGWAVDAFEAGMGVICIRRYFTRSWHSTHSATRVFPLVIGAACVSWGLGDVASTIEALGGATIPVPSVADGFFTGFFPACFIAFM